MTLRRLPVPIDTGVSGSQGTLPERGVTPSQRVHFTFYR